MKYTTLICPSCNKTFQKNQASYFNQIKKGRLHFYCSPSCNALSLKEVEPPKLNRTPPLNEVGELAEQLLPFRWFILQAQNRHKGEVGLSTRYLKSLWEEQQGICPLTGWRLNLPIDSKMWKDNRLPWNASLDRLDNSKGYQEGNVRFVALIANYARNIFSDQQLIEFANAVISKEDRIVDTSCPKHGPNWTCSDCVNNLKMARHERDVYKRCLGRLFNALPDNIELNLDTDTAKIAAECGKEEKLNK